MRRMSIAGALVAIALGAVAAFAVRVAVPHVDLQRAGVFVMLGGAIDLLIRFLIADSPLLGPQTAEVAAVVEPLGEPVLDAAGNPISMSDQANPLHQPRPPLVSPLPGTLPEVPRTVVLDSGQALVAPSEWPVTPAAGGRHAELGAGEATAHDRAVDEYRRAIQASETEPPDVPESAVSLTTLTGKPVYPRGNRSRRAGRRG